MTDKQKAAFLRKEGWRRYKVSDGTYGLDGWRDTKEKHVLESLAPIEIAYRLAHRRKSQRETRGLKAAGFRFVERDLWVWDPLKVNGGREAGIPSYTRSEALALLAESDRRAG